MADAPDENVKETSLAKFIATLAPVSLIAGVCILIFLILRKSQRRFYAPRTYLGTLREQYVHSFPSEVTITDVTQRAFYSSTWRIFQLDWPLLEDPRCIYSPAPISRCLPLPSISPYDCGHHVRWCLYHLACVRTPIQKCAKARS